MAASVSVVEEESYYALIALADHFQKIGKIRNAIHCLHATLCITLPDLLEASGRLAMAKLLLRHTTNFGHARGHLEQALQKSQFIKQEFTSKGFGFMAVWIQHLLKRRISESIITNCIRLDKRESGTFNDQPAAEKIYFESVSLLAKVCDQQDQRVVAKNLLRTTLERSSLSNIKVWHYRMVFQLAESHVHDKELPVALQLLSMLGEATADVNGHVYVRCLFTLSKCQLLLMSKSYQRFEQEIYNFEQYLASCNFQSPFQQENIKVYYGSLKVYWHLVTGKVKSGKNRLKELQHSIQTLTTVADHYTTSNDPEALIWLPKEHLCIFIYLLTVMHAVQSGGMERALKYAEKAMQYVARVKGDEQLQDLTSTFHISLCEHSAVAQIIKGQGTIAIKEINSAYQLSINDSKYSVQHKAVVHTLLGLYGTSMNLMVEAERHFRIAMQLSNPTSSVYCVAALNLLIIYVRHSEEGKAGLEQVMNSLDSTTITSSQVFHASYFYIRGLQSFFLSNFHEAKKFLREALKLGNVEDINRITASSLVLLGHTVTYMGNPQEALTMVAPAMEIASKIPDVYLQLWAASLLKDIYNFIGNVNMAAEGAQLHQMYTSQLLEDHFQASQIPEHSLLQKYMPFNEDENEIYEL